eukprot:gene13828-16901_t
MARLTQGVADDLLTTLVLATDAPVALAPAMNQAMWRDPATQANAEALAKRGLHLFGPASGSQACGDIGLGRMLDGGRKKSSTPAERSALSPTHQERTGPQKAGSANRAGSGHGGSSESSDVRHPQGGRTKNAPEDETDLMPQIGFLFSHLLRDPPPPKKSRNMTTLTQLPGLRVRAENPNHHLWNNHGT